MQVILDFWKEKKYVTFFIRYLCHEKMQKSEVDRRDILKLGRTTSYLQMLSREGV